MNFKLSRHCHLSCVQTYFKVILSTLHNGWPLLPLCIDLRLQVMRIAFLLLLVAPLAGLAAPIEKPSSPYLLVNAQAAPNEISPICYRHWRHHGHLTFRLARVQPCNGRTEQQYSSANTNGFRAIPWVG